MDITDKRQSHRSESTSEQEPSDSPDPDEVTGSDDDSDEPLDYDQLEENKFGEDDKDDQRDEYEGQDLNAKNLTWDQMARKHYQAFSLLQGQYSGYNSKHLKAIRDLGGDTKRIYALKEDFRNKTSGLGQSIDLTRKKAYFCDLMNYHGNKDWIPEDRFFRRPAQLPDVIQAAAIGTLSLNAELRSATRPHPLPPDVIEAATMQAESIRSLTTYGEDYPDILYSQRHLIAQCLNGELSDYLPGQLGSISGLNSPHDCFRAFPHIFDEIDANRGPWAPNYPPATLPSARPAPESTGSTQREYARNPQGAHQQERDSYSAAPPGGSRNSYSTSYAAPPHSSGTDPGYHPSSSNTYVPPAGSRWQTGGTSGSQYSARR